LVRLGWGYLKLALLAGGAAESGGKAGDEAVELAFGHIDMGGVVCGATP
jgi:hypothetical protein